MSKMLKSSEVAGKLSLSMDAFYAFRRKTPDFPEPVMLSTKVARWAEEDVDAWITQKKEDPHGQTS